MGDIEEMLAAIERGYGSRTSVILIDSNTSMPLVGAPHAHKTDAQRLLEKLVAERRRLTTDVEVFREILHWYAAVNRRDAIEPAFDALLGTVDEVLPIDQTVVDRAKQIVLASFLRVMEFISP